MRFLLIVNPTSGGGRQLHRLQKALKFFRKKGDVVEVHQTLGPGDGTEVVLRRRDEGFDAVIAAGGDGTLHEVIEALAGSPVPLGILPWGTGNVFAREMGLPRRTKALCRLIRKNRPTTIDLGSADGKPFLMMASWGLDAYALGTMSGRFKRFWGMGAYALAGLGALVRYRHPDMEVTLADGTVDRGGFVLVSNTKLYGAFFVFHPQADPSDGALDVLVFRHTGRWKFLGMVFHMVWRKVTAPRSTQSPPFLSRHGVYRTPSLTLTTPKAPAQADGEFLPSGASEIRVLPSALRVFVP